MELYHVLSRGVDKRVIFNNNKDYFRFVHNLFVLNDKNSVTASGYFFNKADKSAETFQNGKSKNKEPRKLLVKIHTFCLMPNHYHLLLSPLVEDGIVKFMRKLNISYAKYFNIKNERKGALFESRYKSILVKDENHFLYLPYYIHMNPLDLYSPEWREERISRPKEAMLFLEKYRWSGLPDYIGIKNFPSVTSRNFLQEVLGSSKKYQSNFLVNLQEMKEVIGSESFSPLLLE